MSESFLSPENYFKNDYNFTCNCECTGHSCRSAVYSSSGDYYSYAIIGDGLEGDAFFRADRGARFAVDIFRDHMENDDFLKKYDAATHDTVNEIVEDFWEDFVRQWNGAVVKDVLEDPISESETANLTAEDALRVEKNPAVPYSTAVTAFVCGRIFAFGVKIGGGKCILVNSRGQIYQPVRQSDRSSAASLSDGNAPELFGCWTKYFYDDMFPAAVFLGSNSLQSVFCSDEKLYDFIRQSLFKVAESADDSSVKELENTLPLLSDGTDMTLAILLNYSRMSYDSARFEGTGRLIHINNYGDMDSDERGSRYYNHDTMLPVKVGSYAVWMGRYSQRYVDILSVDEDGVKISYRGEEYLLTASDQLVLRETERQATYDGPWHEAEDRTSFTLLW